MCALLGQVGVQSCGWIVAVAKLQLVKVKVKACSDRRKRALKLYLRRIDLNNTSHQHCLLSIAGEYCYCYSNHVTTVYHCHLDTIIQTSLFLIGSAVNTPL